MSSKGKKKITGNQLFEVKEGVGVDAALGSPISSLAHHPPLVVPDHTQRLDEVNFLEDCFLHILQFVCCQNI